MTARLVPNRDLGFRPFDSFSHRPLRKVVHEEPLYRTLANGRKVQNRFQLTLECGCTVIRVIPIPKTAVCHDPSH